MRYRIVEYIGNNGHGADIEMEIGSGCWSRIFRTDNLYEAQKCWYLIKIWGSHESVSETYDTERPHGQADAQVGQQKMEKEG